MSAPQEIAKRYTVRQAAKRYGLSPRLLYDAVRDRQIEFYAVANRFELTDAAVQTFLDAARQPALAVA